MVGEGPLGRTAAATPSFRLVSRSVQGSGPWGTRLQGVTRRGQLCPFRGTSVPHVQARGHVGAAARHTPFSRALQPLHNTCSSSDAPTRPSGRRLSPARAGWQACPTPGARTPAAPCSRRRGCEWFFHAVLSVLGRTRICPSKVSFTSRETEAQGGGAVGWLVS